MQKFKSNQFHNENIVFINHSSSLTGAPIYLYDLITILEKQDLLKNLNLILLDVEFNEKIKNIYKSIKNIYFYNNNKANLKFLLQKFNPILIYSNSINIFNQNINYFDEFLSRTIIHYHEYPQYLENETRCIDIKQEKINYGEALLKKYKHEYQKSNNKKILFEHIVKLKKKILFLESSKCNNWNCYLNRYSDLRKVFGTNPILGEKHYNEYGIKEGRNNLLCSIYNQLLNNDKNLMEKKLISIINVTQSLCEKTEKLFINKKILLIKPFLSSEKMNNIDRLSKINIINSDINLNLIKKKIVFAMIGNKSERKGYDIFINIAKIMDKFNFLWIGDDIDLTINIKNLFQIKHTSNTYKYYQIIDYLLVTSREDPCPIIMLESMYLKTPCFFLKNNIKYDHPVLEKYCIYNHDNNPYIISSFLKRFDLKKNQKMNFLQDYIKKEFTEKEIVNYLLDKISSIKIKNNSLENII